MDASNDIRTYLQSHSNNQIYIHTTTTSKGTGVAYIIVSALLHLITEAPTYPPSHVLREELLVKIAKRISIVLIPRYTSRTDGPSGRLVWHGLYMTYRVTVTGFAGR